MKPDMERGPAGPLAVPDGGGGSDLQPFLADIVARREILGCAAVDDFAVTHDIDPVRDAQRDGEGGPIFVRGDQTMSYGRILEVIGAINGAGFSKVALVTRPPNQGRGIDN